MTFGGSNSGIRLMAYLTAATAMTLGVLEGHSTTAFLNGIFFVYFCTGWQDFEWQSAIAGLLVFKWINLLCRGELLMSVECGFELLLVFGWSVAVSIPAFVLEFGHIRPFQRGFFCDDDSIKYPYTANTVAWDAVVSLGILIPAIAVSF